MTLFILTSRASPREKNNFDCEAIFFAHGKLYLLTKHRVDTLTKLYRFETLDPIGLNEPTLLATFDVGGQVTAADVSEDGKQLAVLTYSRVWLFKSNRNKDDYFSGDIAWASLNRLAAKQCESICFWDQDTLLLGNEQRELYEIKTTDLLKLQL